MKIYAVYATNEDGSFSWIDSYWLNYKNVVARFNKICIYEREPTKSEIDHYVREVTTQDDVNEIVKNWLIKLYEREIRVALNALSIERTWLMGTDVWEEEKMQLDNMISLNEYITILKTLLNDIKEEK